MSQFNRNLIKTIEWLVAILLGIAVLFILMQVIFRYILYSPLTWTEQSSRYMFIWMMMLGAAVMFYRDGAVAFDLLFHKVPEKQRFWLQVMIHISVIAFSVYYAYEAFILASKVIGRTTSGVQVPLTFMYSSMCISNICIISVVTEKLIDQFRKKNALQETEGKLWD